MVVIECEYGAFLINQTWVLVDPPSLSKVIGSLWMYRTKENPNGTINN